VEHLSGSEQAKERLKVILQTITGECRVLEACAQLGICEQRFHQLRQQALEAALGGLEAGTPGRPVRQPSPAEEQLAAARQQLDAMAVELRTARAREEIALALPNAVQPPAAPEKKTRGRPRRLPPLPLGQRSRG
jgi:hypothetical protein